MGSVGLLHPFHQIQPGTCVRQFLIRQCSIKKHGGLKQIRHGVGKTQSLEFRDDILFSESVSAVAFDFGNGNKSDSAVVKFFWGTDDYDGMVPALVKQFPDFFRIRKKIRFDLPLRMKCFEFPDNPAPEIGLPGKIFGENDFHI